MAQDDMSASDVPVGQVSNPSSEPVRVSEESRSVSVKLAGPLAATHIIHSIPGRVRLRVPTLKTNSHLARGLERLLSAQAGVIEVTVAPVCQSVTVVYDLSVWTPKSLCIFLQNRDREELDQYASAALPDDSTNSFAMTWLRPWRFLNMEQRSPDGEGSPQIDGPVTRGFWTVGYASMVVGVVLFAVPGVPGVPFLILSTYCFSKATIWKTGDVSDAGAQVPKAGQ
ncbi:MAG TPA: hypothetical protein VF077_05500 [Nitrospiraceae bacterium]